MKRDIKDIDDLFDSMSKNDFIDFIDRYDFNIVSTDSEPGGVVWKNEGFLLSNCLEENLSYNYEEQELDIDLSFAA